MQRGFCLLSKTASLLQNSHLQLVIQQKFFSSHTLSVSPFKSIMAGLSSGTELERLKARAELTDKILADIKTKLAAVKKAAIEEANAKEEERLRNDINKRLTEIADLKKALMLAEIGNGVRQIRLPTQAEVAACLAKVAASTPPEAKAPQVNGEATKEQTTPAKKEGGQKTKPADKPDAGGKKAKAEKSGKGEKGEAKPKKSGGATAGAGDSAEGPVDISRLDMRVGKIVGVDKHPDADSLYVEQVDLGEGRTRTIVSGLVKHVPISAMKDRIAVFMCNLKPAKMRGVLSEGMIMCASSPEKVEILVPPADAAIGDRVTVKEFPGTPDAQLNPKKKIWETLKPDVRTNADRVATFKGGVFNIEGKGVVVAPTLANTQIS